MSVSGRLRLGEAHPEVKAAAEWALSWAAFYGVPITVTSVFRSWEEQQRLYTRYLQGRSRWPANKPGDSSHNYGFSFDSTTESLYQEWWTMVRRMAGFEVLEHDIIHAQVPNWRQYV